ncbi:AAA family ATPase, partial [Patescibacteria group bacterium]
LVSLEQSISELESDRNRVQKTYDERQLETNELNGKINTVREKLHRQQRGEEKKDASPEFKNEIAEITKAQKTLIHEIENCSDISKLPEIQDLASEIRERLEGLTKRLDQGEAASAQDLLVLQQELNMLLEQKESKSQELSEVTVKLQTTQANISSTQKRIDSVKSELESLEQKLQVGSNGSNKENILYLADKKTDIEKKVGDLNQKILDTRNALKSLDEEELERKKGFLEIEKSLQKRRDAASTASQEKNRLEVDKARLEVKKEDLDREISEDIGYDALRALTEEEKQEIDQMSEEQKEGEHKKIERLQVQLTKIGGIDEDVVEEHKEVEERYNFLLSQSEDLEQAAKDLRAVIEKLDKQIKKEFNESFRRINKEFDRFFKILFSGGSAKLSLVRPEKKKKQTEEGEEDLEEESDLDEEDPTLKSSVEGVEIKANPPGKKLKSLSMLSGGEKSLTAIALLSAIIANNPSPFVVLDEVDAALDDANARRYARILDKLDEKTQFIVITHNHETMRMAKILYGVTMQRDGVSKMLSIKLEDVGSGGQIKGQDNASQKAA